MNVEDAQTIWQALEQQDAARLTELCSNASASDLCVVDPEGNTPLVSAITSNKYDCARVLIGYEEALGIPADELKAWKLIQKCKKEAELEDTEEPVDVQDEEWQKEQNAAIFGAGKLSSTSMSDTRLGLH